MSSIRTPLTVSPHEYFGDVTGRPLDYGTIYFGEPDKDPEFYPIDVYSDEALTQPIPQPIRTKGGFINVNGDIIDIFGRPAIYSVKVLDKYGRKIFYKGKAMRNNVNDDIIAEIDAAIQQSKDDGVEYAKKAVREAINKEAIEGSEQVDTFVVATPKFDGAIARNQAEKNRENTTWRDFRKNNNLDITDAVNECYKRNIPVKLEPLEDKSKPYILGALDTTNGGVLSGTPGTPQSPITTIVKVKKGQTLLDYSDKEGHFAEVKNLQLMGEKDSGNFSPNTNFFIDKSEDSLNQYYHIEGCSIRNFDTAISHHNGWGHSFERLNIQWCNVGIETTPSKLLGSWTTSGFSVKDTYIGACEYGIKEGDAWNATYINTIVEWSGHPYVQGAGGSAPVWINPWFESNTNPPSYRKGTIILGGRGHDFSDVKFEWDDNKDVITYMHRRGINIITDNDMESPARPYNGSSKINTPLDTKFNPKKGKVNNFAVSGSGIDTFRGSDELGVDFGRYFESTPNAKIDDGKYFVFNASSITSKEDGTTVREGGGGIVGISSRWDSPVPKGTPIVGMYGVADRWGVYDKKAPRLGVELTGGTNDAGNGQCFVEVRLSSGRYEKDASGNVTGTYGDRWILDYAGHFTPAADNTFNIGYLDKRIKQIFTATDAVTTSDERLKTELLNVEDAEIACALELKKNIRKYKMLDSVEQKGKNNARIHFGIGAQTVADIFGKHGLNANDYALFCRDEWYEIDGVVVDDTHEDFEKAELNYRLGIRYNELSMFILAAI